MATKRSLNFLPSIFQTDTNRKFLSATMDQLISDPEFVRLNGYVGRKFAPTYKTNDSYLPEVDLARQNYQLEPSVLLKNKNNKIEFYSNYPDLINKISYYGGATNNHSRLFSNEYYAFNGLFDQDKFVNYQQYYWVPNGPTPIRISSTFVESQQTFRLDNNTNSIRIAGFGNDNPEIVLSRGGLYKFVIDSPGHNIYIQTEPGVRGVKTAVPNQSSREVYGVANNGVDAGIIEFKVPLVDVQDVYLKMPYGPLVDYATNLSYSALDGSIWDQIVSQFNGIDGINVLPAGKTIIFVNPISTDSDWVTANGSTIPESLRQDVYKIRITENENQQNIVNLDYVTSVAVNNRIYVRLGETTASKEFYLNSSGQYIQIPLLTAQLDVLYYQDATNPAKFGKIRLVNNAINSVNVDTSILGKKNYTSPMGVNFTNGMVVLFDNQIEPNKYANKKFVVEGVGKSIRLVDFSNLVFPEPGVTIKEIEWDSTLYESNAFSETYQGPADPDYIVMNRSSLDLNAWARHNRWFHADVIIKSAELNNITLDFSQLVRAQRPIIEYNADIQLFNSGRVGKRPIDHIDTIHTNAFLQVQGRTTLIKNGNTLKKGQRILFTNDVDPLVRSQVYVVEFINQSKQSYESVYDGTGTGLITINPYTMDFFSTNLPQQIIDNTVIQPADVYNWKWVVQGSANLLDALKLSGVTGTGGFVGHGIVTNVIQIDNNQFEILFDTNFNIENFNNRKVDILGPSGLQTIQGTNTLFLSELEPGTEIYLKDDVFVGVVSGVTKNNVAQLETIATVPTKTSEFWYKKPKIQLKLSNDPDDVMLPYDAVVALDGENKGKTFWLHNTNWVQAQIKNKRNAPILFDVFDSNEKSFSTYNLSNFLGTKIYSYKPGTGQNDPILGFPISYTSTYSVADITFYHDFGNDMFQYRRNNIDIKQKIETGFLRQNIDRYRSIRRNTWSPVKELSQQYQIISKTYTGESNYFEIDITGNDLVDTPAIKVFLNNKLLNLTQYRPYVKINKINTVLISADILAVGDKVDILIFSNETSNIGYYQVPVNLEYNSKNEQLVNITLGQLRNNLSTIGENLEGILGNVPGNSNIRDIDIENTNGNLLQSSAPLIYANLFLVNETINFVNSIEFARKEYTKFKSKFLEMCNSLKGLDITDPSNGVDTILLSINSVKNKSFPWYYSDMVPYGKASTTSYIVDNTSQRRYIMQSNFDDTKIQNKAVLVYINNRQLVKGKDYAFDKLAPFIQLQDSLITVLGDSIEIKEYESTDANFIPETPTKLGLYQKFVPGIFLDDTYRQPVFVIQGHDGSLTPAFNDFRDNFLLELENRIFNNIKFDSNKKVFDVRTIIPGRFRDSEYSLTEYNNILNTSFLKWAGSNKVNVSTNKYFNNSDPFTYNYKQTRDLLFNESLPGYWRGIYQYFYDTDKPHTHPWEMLGFTEKPLWWEMFYGAAPYTKDNAILWGDLELGLIRYGSTAGIHKNYSRPGLSKIIPVDSQGELLSPMTTIAIPLNMQTVESSFAIGDVGPAEAAWRRTSEFPYALQIAAALMKPAMYFGTLMDTNGYYKTDFYNQYLCENTNNRITPSSLILNGEIINNNVSRARGYVNWIIDYLTSTGVDGPAKLRSTLDTIEVQLGYKVAGFVDKKYLTVLAEQYSPTSTNDSVVIPDDSYNVHMNKSVPVEKIVYSAVIVEKTNTGYALSGYNLNNPYFVVIPSEVSGDKYTINVENVNALIYKSFIKEKLVIPYGTEFNTRQQVVDFLVSYQRALIAQGFTFNTYDTDLLQIRDWILSIREFITWTLQGWKEGSILVLSPVNNILTVNTINSVVDQITSTASGSRLLDPNFSVIKNTEITVLRDSGDFKVTNIAGKTIALAELNLVQFEHVLIFDNNTIFNDVIYKPDSGNRQYRLKLVGNKTDNWDGSLNAPGFVYNNDVVAEWRSGVDYLRGDLVSYKQQYYVAIQKIPAATQFDFNYWKQIPKSDIKTGLLRNFSNNAGKFINFYDVDASLLDNQINRLHSGLIGFRSRQYLTNLNVNQTSQTKFYQGMIKNKGTSQSINNLKNAKFDELINDIEYFEEWAFRVGEYGALSSTNVLEIVLNEEFNKKNPIGLTFDNTYEQNGIITIKDQNLINPFTQSISNKFINRPEQFVSNTDIQSAGYVNIDDVNATLFDINDYQTLNSKINEIISGYTIWIGKDYNKDWNVYRASETDTQILKIEYNLNNFAKVFTKDPHNLLDNLLVAIRNFDDRFNGFYVISNVGLREFTIPITEAQSQLLKKKTVLSLGQLFSLNSVRYTSPAEIDSFTPRYGWRDNDLVWIDSDENNKWAVIKKYNTWEFNTTLPLEITNELSNINYGTSVKINKNFAIVGAPGNTWTNSIIRTGRIHLFDRNTFNELNIVDPNSFETDIKGLGSSIDLVGDTVATGAPLSNEIGLVVIYKFQVDQFNPLIPIQIIDGSSTVGAQFGYSCTLSQDSKWLYVGAPGENRVYTYSLIEYETKYSFFTIDKFDRGCLLPYQLDDIRAISVYYENNLFKADVDYYLVNNTIKFRNPPTQIDPASKIVIIRRSFYENVGSIYNEDDSEFGYSVKTNTKGDLLFVGAPKTNINRNINDIPTVDIQSGAVYLYKNGFDVVNTTLQLELLEKFELNATGYRARFGTSIDYAYETGSVYITAPGYSTSTFSGGAVFRYVLSDVSNGAASITMYTLAQEMFRPLNLSSENFGSVVKVSANDTNIVISSTKGTAKTTSIIDSKKTIFDGGATIFLDVTPGTGAVYLYEFMTGGLNSANKYGNFIFATEFNAPSLRHGDQFGCSVDFDNNEMFIGASFNDTYELNSGAVYVESNPAGNPVWDIFRKQTAKVDPNSINSISLYNKLTKVKLASLDYIDPAKGKILGIAEQNLNYKTSHDPAAYNAGTANKNSQYINLHWNNRQVGQTWWNLNSIRYIDYEQSELIYRLNNWGKLFPGSTISVYEWVESNVIPSQYVANNNPGVPLYPNDEYYVEIQYSDRTAGSIRTKYYFWVAGLSTVASGSRTLSILGIEDAIKNPKNQSIPYSALLADNSIALFNCDSYITGTDAILKVDYDVIPNDTQIHSEFALLQEDKPNSVIPSRLLNKIIDSLAGEDSAMRKVPSIFLKPDQILGLETRPAQTLIINRVEAIKNVIRFTNSVLKNILISQKLKNNNLDWFSEPTKPIEFDHSALNQTELSYINLVPNQTVLVESDEEHHGLWTLYKVQANRSLKLIKNQSYKTQNFWSYKNWYKDGFDPDTVPNYTVANYKDIQTLSLREGDVVKVNNNNKGFEIYIFLNEAHNELVAVENGTVELNENQWSNSNYDGSFGNSFGNVLFDQDQSRETRFIISGLLNDIFVDDLLVNYNKLIFIVIKYILTEQKNVDWIFKTSFISVLHKIKKLEQYPNYVKDNHEYFEEYINEIKPYKTKLREYAIAYTSTDVSYTSVTDFDLPGYFDKDLNRFRSPSGEYLVKDNMLLASPTYVDWTNNFTFGVESMIIGNGGNGYNKDVQVKIIANGDGGTGASATAIVNEITGEVLKVHVTHHGTGYKNTPFVVISGTGTGATATARLVNHKIRSIRTILKFDRIAYNTQVREWQPGVVYNKDDIVSYNGKGYKAKITKSNLIFSFSDFILLQGKDFISANDRLASTYYPNSQQIPKEVDANGNINLDRLIPGVLSDINKVQSNFDVFSESTVNGPIAYNTDTGTEFGDINVVGLTHSDVNLAHAPEELVAGTTLDTLNMCVSTIVTNPYNSAENKIVKFRILRDAQHRSNFKAVPTEGIATLVKPFHYNDSAMYLNDVSNITLPNRASQIPGHLYINGEKIKFWKIDTQNNAIMYPIRGISNTGVPLVHPIGTIVEDHSVIYDVPDIVTYNKDQFVYTEASPKFIPYFKVDTDLQITSTRLSVSIGVSKLTYIDDYTLEISQTGTVTITFVHANIKDGVQFDASYQTEQIWLNAGIDTLTDGQGLNGSTTPAAIFMKRYVHDLP